MRAFIFSLDAFVAFTLALIAIYSLIFFSSVPSSYYYLLTQSHYLSRDVLMALSTTTCSQDYHACGTSDVSLLEHMVSQSEGGNQKAFIEQTVGSMIPERFGYLVEIKKDDLDGWQILYDTAVDSDDHARLRKKITVSSQVISFDYVGETGKLERSPYTGCSGDFTGTSAPGAGESWEDWGVITCGIGITSDEEGEPNARGNEAPENRLGELVPSSDFAIVRLTVYI